LVPRINAFFSIELGNSMNKVFTALIMMTIASVVVAYQPPAVTEMRGGNNNNLLPNQLNKDRALSVAVLDRIKNDYTTGPYANQIDVYAIDGVVTLTGRVDNNRVRLAMEYKARGVSGVRMVINDIELVY